jgi:hypothetical protein
MPFHTQLVGAFAPTDSANPTADRKFAVGTIAPLSDGGFAMYVQALSELSTFAAVAIYANSTAQMLTTTLAATTKRVGYAQVSIASGYYGWVQLSGVVKVNLAASCDDNVALYTTSTSGVLDDATVSGGLIVGLTNTVTISNATAVTCIAAGISVVGTGATPGA